MSLELNSERKRFVYVKTHNFDALANIEYVARRSPYVIERDASLRVVNVLLISVSLHDACSWKIVLVL